MSGDHNQPATRVPASRPASQVVVGVDTGGTFTDLVMIEEGRLRVHKVLSTPKAPDEAIVQGINELGLGGRDLLVIHGSTVATNAVLEQRGVRCALVTNRGFGDLLSLGRQNRPRLYDLRSQRQPVPVAPELCLEVDGRVAADGKIIEPLSASSIEKLRQRLTEFEPEAVAICLLFSYLTDQHERELEAALAKPEEDNSFFVTRSSEVLPLAGEFERGLATWLNAYVGPLMHRYLNRLREQLPSAEVSVMQSSATTVDAGKASRRAVHLLLSGPAGGLAAASFLGKLTGQPRIMTLDMGGTSTDVALLDGEVPITLEGGIGAYPVSVPMVDMHTIGAGGGSLATVDSGGLLQVGPRSAGAHPGPACYGAGGGATVTDANLVLGRLPPSVRLGGHLSLDRAAALNTLAELGRQLGLRAEEAAAGVIEVANAHMSQALRVISIERGHDPSDYTLCCFGGAGGLHVCDLAESLGMRRALVPIHSGVLSALGMLSVPPGREYSKSICRRLSAIPAHELESAFEALSDQGTTALVAEGLSADVIQNQRRLDLRYLGQSSTLTLDFADLETLIDQFHNAHEHRFGHRLDRPVELVNLRLSVTGPPPSLALPAQPDNAESGPADTSRVADVDVPVWRRLDLAPGQQLSGPLIVIDDIGTSWVKPGWRLTCDPYGNLELTRDSEALNQSELS